MEESELIPKENLLDGTESPYLFVKKKDSVFTVYRSIREDGAIIFKVTAEKTEKGKVYSRPGESHEGKPFISHLSLVPSRNGKDMEIGHVWTVKDYRGRLIQSLLVKLAEHEAGEKGAKKILVHSTDQGMLLYDSANFEPAEGNHHFFTKHIMPWDKKDIKPIRSIEERDRILASEEKIAKRQTIEDIKIKNKIAREILEKNRELTLNEIKNNTYLKMQRIKKG